MIKIKLKVDGNKLYATEGTMYAVWAYEFEHKPTEAEVELTTDLYDTEKEWLEKVLEWVYDGKEGTVRVNGKDYSVSEFVNG